MCNRIETYQPYSFSQFGKRESQQDARFPPYLDAPPSENRTYVICDGVGGEACGEVASRIVANRLGEYITQLTDDGSDLTKDGFAHALNATAKALNEAVEYGSPHMSTTITALHFNNNNAIVAHMGDSRIYQIRPGIGIIYRSNDHSLVNSLVHSGNITPQEAINHPKSNYITRFMSPIQPGAYPTPADVLTITDIEPGDCFVLCTDGVLHCIDDEQLVEILSHPDSSDSEACAIMAQLSADSSDNNTATIVRVKSVPEQFETFEIDTDQNNSAQSQRDPAEPCETTIISPESQADTITEIAPEIEPQREKGLFGWLKNMF